MPMQPRPIADTEGPLRPSCRRGMRAESDCAILRVYSPDGTNKKAARHRGGRPWMIRSRVLLDFLFLGFVGGNAQRTKEALVVRADFKVAAIAGARGLLSGRADLGERARRRTIHEANDCFEGDLHLKPGRAGSLTTRFNPRIF